MMQLILIYCVTTSILTTCFLTQKQKLYHWLSDEKNPLHFHEKCQAWPKHPVGPLTGATAKKTMRSSARLCCAFFKWDFSSGKRLKTCRVWQACRALWNGILKGEIGRGAPLLSYSSAVA